ncbi:DUF7118 family protein [Haloparvum sp. PAK95]|uniref:DUF7118 family protein n=1 Tax=Haloparvum sp. PAK95 TaxID=3418962 RepID=UPI003D2F1FEA
MDDPESKSESASASTSTSATSQSVESKSADADAPPLPEDGPIRTARDAAATLRERYDEVERIEARIERLGQDRVEAAADTYRRAHRVLDQYEDDATGTGDFGSYVEFEGEFSDAVDVDDDALAADAFAAADEAVDKRRLSTDDFDAARDALDPAGEYVTLLERRDDAVDDYRIARRDLKKARDDLEDRIEELEAVAEYADVDLTVPLEELREQFEGYNDAVREAFDEFLKTASARETFDFLEATERYPLVDFDAPPRDLSEYVDEYAAGEEPLPQLLEYADYSQSKLDHYVEDPGALRTAVAVHRTWIERLDGEPLTLGWPPEPADEIQYRVQELTSLVSRVADEDVVADLRAIGDRSRKDDYETCRRAAKVTEEFDEREQALIEANAAGDRLAEAEETLALVEEILTETER